MSAVFPTTLREIADSTSPFFGRSTIREAANELERLYTAVENLDLGQRALAEYSKNLEAQIVTLLSTLAAVEWYGGEFGSFCPWCGGSDPNDTGWRATLIGHSPNCHRQAALKGSEQ